MTEETLTGEAPPKKLTKRFVLLLLLGMMLAQALLHLPFFSKEPMGQHVWRQVVGHAMARNYHTESADFFAPRNDIRPYAENDGKIWHEFPMVYWLIGKSYQYTGVQPANARVIWFLFSVLCIPIAYIFARQMHWDRLRSLLFSYCFSFVPYFYYYSITLAPNLHGLMWFLLGFALLLRAERKDFRCWEFVGGLVFLSLATVSKPTYLFFGLPVAALFLWSYAVKRNRQILISAGIGGGFVAMTNGLIIWHASRLYAAAPVEQQVHTPIGPAERPENWGHAAENLTAALTMWFGELFVGFAALPLFLAGLVLGVVGFWRLANRDKLIWLAWLVSFAAFAYVFVVRFKDHSYYITSTLPIAAAVSSYGAYRLLHASRHWRQAAIVLLILMPIVMVGRIYKRWNDNTQVPPELLNQSAEFKEVIPENDRVVVLGDRSPIVFLYFLERKGVAEGSQLSPERLAELRDKGGINWLVSYTPRAQVENIKAELQEVRSIGQFQIYDLTTKKPITTGLKSPPK